MSKTDKVTNQRVPLMYCEKDFDYEHPNILYWFDYTGQLWRIHLFLKGRIDRSESPISMELSSWEEAENCYVDVIFGSRYSTILNSDEELNMILLAKDPDGYDYVRAKDGLDPVFYAESLLLSPQIRILEERWGFCAFHNQNVASLFWSEEDYRAIEQLTRPGKTREEILYLPLSPKDKTAFSVVCMALQKCKRPLEWFFAIEKYKKENVEE